MRECATRFYIVLSGNVSAQIEMAPTHTQRDGDGKVHGEIGDAFVFRFSAHALDPTEQREAASVEL